MTSTGPSSSAILLGFDNREIIPHFWFLQQDLMGKQKDTWTFPALNHRVTVKASSVHLSAEVSSAPGPVSP